MLAVGAWTGQWVGIRSVPKECGREPGDSLLDGIRDRESECTGKQ